MFMYEVLQPLQMTQDFIANDSKTTDFSARIVGKIDKSRKAYLNVISDYAISNDH